jgi:hypothetical protein
MKTEAIHGVLERVLENPAAKADPLVLEAIAEVLAIDRVRNEAEDGRAHDCAADDDCERR